ncbi:PEPxxWA-CTERM sorting domain-containing protein [Sphingomonas elodea]|uniref:PEPxxWA-CTERM sorting domain-containing protein n=1 Tax=Sphingomonas elodea TaxID=179878 RepID=UPI001110B2F3|nr:PEPxxWA-CTERM sorting domain-containing protein [Sphingomonas elodea]
MRIVTRLAAAAALTCVAAPAGAATLIGQINFTGFVRPIGAPTMNAATGLDFYQFSLPASPANDGGIPGTLFSVLGTSGVFAGLACIGPCGTIKDLPTFTSGPIASFFDIGSTIFFDLASITSVTVTPDGSGGGLKILAKGTFRVAGFTDTPGAVSLTTQGSGLTSFSATAFSAVPEPANWAMLIAGFGFAGGMLRTARRTIRVRFAAH